MKTKQRRSNEKAGKKQRRFGKKGSAEPQGYLVRNHLKREQSSIKQKTKVE